MIVYLDVSCASQTDGILFLVVVKSSTGQGKWDLDTVISLRFSSLHTAAAFGTMSSDVLEIDCRSNHLNVTQRELGTLRDYATVHGNEGATVVVKAVAITALLVSVQVYPS